MNIIKPIETRYKGYRFRSRLEARWAVFFDELGIEWEYEKEGFDISGIRYLPDFWLSTVNLWAEVKPQALNDRERILTTQLSVTTGYDVLWLVGVPENHPYGAISQYGSQTYCLTNYKDYPQREHRFYGNPSDEDWDNYFDDTLQASIAAKSARFEFGERGK